MIQFKTNNQKKQMLFFLAWKHYEKIWFRLLTEWPYSFVLPPPEWVNHPIIIPCIYKIPNDNPNYEPTSNSTEYDYPVNTFTWEERFGLVACFWRC